MHDPHRKEPLYFLNHYTYSFIPSNAQFLPPLTAQISNLLDSLLLSL